MEHKFKLEKSRSKFLIGSAYISFLASLLGLGVAALAIIFCILFIDIPTQHISFGQNEYEINPAYFLSFLFLFFFLGLKTIYDQYKRAKVYMSKDSEKLDDLVLDSEGMLFSMRSLFNHNSNLRHNRPNNVFFIKWEDIKGYSIKEYKSQKFIFFSIKTDYEPPKLFGFEIIRDYSKDRLVVPLSYFEQEAEVVQKIKEFSAEKEER